MSRSESRGVSSDDFQVYLFLLIGSFCLLIATLFAGNAEMVLGATEASFYSTLGISFVLIVISGIFWISAAKKYK